MRGGVSSSLFVYSRSLVYFCVVIGGSTWLRNFSRILAVNWEYVSVEEVSVINGSLGHVQAVSRQQGMVQVTCVAGLQASSA